MISYSMRREFYQIYVPYIIVNVGIHKGTECDAGTSYIHAATIGKLLLHFLSVALLHDIL